MASIFVTCERLQTTDGHTEWTKPISQLQITSNMFWWPFSGDGTNRFDAPAGSAIRSILKLHSHYFFLWIFLDKLKTWYKTILFNLPVSFLLFSIRSLLFYPIWRSARPHKSETCRRFLLFMSENYRSVSENIQLFVNFCVSHKSRELPLKLFGLFCFYFSCVQNLTFFFTWQMQIKRSEPLKILFWKDCLL